MRTLLVLTIAACSAKTDAETNAAPPEVASSVVASATLPTGHATTSSAAAVPDDPNSLRARSAKTTFDKAKAAGLDPQKDVKTPFEVLTAYHDNALKAAKTFEEKPTIVGGNMARVVGGTPPRVELTDEDMSDPRVRLRLGLQTVRLVLADDATSKDVATALNANDIVIAVCDKGRGRSDEVVSFEGCSIWSTALPSKD